MQICDSCKEGVYRIKLVAFGVWMCSSCANKRAGTIREGNVLLRVVETKFFPSLGNVSKARVAELDRRVQIKDSTVEAGYSIGRRMENGTIAEKNYDDLIRD